ncbi:fatty acyl-AMP ligase [Streptomyces inhibens]|uniref:fatty acyl-AMP ligase n=1 Tax=Streptomyces inhibens TaxID=2293571 RepID=UPI00402AE9C7
MTTAVPTATLLDQLRAYAERQPAATAYTFLDDDGSSQRTLTYADVHTTAQTIAGALRTRLAPGDRALLLLPEGLDFIPAFLGCLQAGVIAVPAYPPLPLQSRQRVETLRSIVGDCRPAAVIVAAPPEAVAAVQGVVPELAGAWWTSVAELAAGPADAAPGPDHRIEPDDIAFLQYTSGSTSLPKGVMVPHRALAHNEEMIRRSFAHEEGVTVVGWLPLFHDMGLIGNVLQPLWLGGHAILMSPMAFIKRPARWLQAISEFRATTSGAPNFAYDMCVRRIREANCEGLDLSSWKVAYNGAEPVRDRTLRAFADRFAPYGFDPAAAYPCYGLAEATLLVTGGQVPAEPARVTIDSQALQAGRIEPSDSGTTLVSSGFTRLDREVIIVDPDSGEHRGADEVGEIWIGGPGLPSGYWGNPDATEQTFGAKPVSGGDGPYLRSGDLGFLHDGQLYVTGRCKDLIIVGGRNHYPQDLEATVEEAHEAIRTGCAAAFAVEDDGGERVVIVAGTGQGATGTDAAGTAKRAEVVRAVRTAVAAAHGITVDDVLPVAPNAVPKTSSGKLQRGACRAAYLRGEYAYPPAAAIDKTLGTTADSRDAQ